MSKGQKLTSKGERAKLLHSDGLISLLKVCSPSELNISELRLIVIPKKN